MVHGCTRVGAGKNESAEAHQVTCDGNFFRECFLLPLCFAAPRCHVWLIDLDKQIFQYLTLYCNPPWLSALCEKIGDLSTYTVPALLFAAIYYWLNSPRFLRFLAVVCILLVLSEGTAYLLKLAIARPRPAVEWLIYIDPKALCFPSAHAVNSMALAVLLSRWFGKSLLWYLPLPLLIGTSRVLANYHYPLDVLGGWMIGFTVATSLWPFFRRFA